MTESRWQEDQFLLSVPILQSYNILYFYDTVGKMKAFKKAPTVAVTTPLL